MKVFFFSAVDFLEGNGANSRLKAYAKGLHQAGIDLSMYFFRSTDFNSTGINTQWEGKWEGIPFTYFSRTTDRPRLMIPRIFQLLSASFQAAGKIREHKDDLDAIYIYSPSAFFLPAYIAAKRSGIPVVVEKTELESTRVAKGLKERIGKWLFKVDEKYINRYADHLIVISEKLKDHYSKSFKKPISLIPAVVDLDRFPLNGNHHSVGKIGYLGSFGDKDGIEGILTAFKSFVDERPGTRLRLMGYNCDPAKLNRQMASVGLNGEVENLGQLKYDEIPQRLSECDLLIVNRTNSPYSHYGFPTKLTEYLASSVPSVVTNVGDIPKYLTNGVDAIIIRPEDNEALSGIFRDYYSNPEEYVRIGRAGRKTCERHFDYQLYIPKLIKIFQELSSKNKS